jgi:hypothetical protein
VQPRDLKRKLGHASTIPSSPPRVSIPARTAPRPAGIQSRSLPQTDERQEVPSTRLSGRRPGSTGSSKASTSRARTGCAGGGAPYLAGWAPQYQHAGLPRGRSLCAVWNRRLERRQPRQPLPALRCGSPRMLAVHVLRPGQPLRVHAADSGAYHPEERQELVHAIFRPYHGRAGNHRTALRQCAKGV